MNHIMEKASIVIPVYNGENYIVHAVNSCLNQDYDNIEILLINDGSKDNSDRICESMQEKYPNVKYYYQDNQGQGTARNLGVEKASGKYIFFLDVDDEIESNTVSQCVEKMKKNGGELCLFDFCMRNETGKIVGGIPNPLEDGFYQEDKIKHIVLNILGPDKWTSDKSKHSLNGSAYSMSVCRFAYTREFLLSNNIKFKLRTYEDLTFPMECLIYCKKLVTIDKYFYKYNISNMDSTTHVSESIQLKRRIEQYEELKRLADLVPYKDEFLDRMRIRMAFVLDSAYYSVSNDIKLSFKEKIKMIKDTYKNEDVLEAVKVIKKSGSKFDFIYWLIKKGYAFSIYLYEKLYRSLLNIKISVTRVK